MSRRIGLAFAVVGAASVLSGEPAPAACAGPAVTLSADAPAHHQREDSWSIIAGGTVAENARVAALADRLIAHLESAGFSAAQLRGRKVVVLLKPGSESPVPRLHPDSGQTVLELDAGLASTDAGAAARALARAFCTRLARANAREGRPAPWFVAALAEEALATGNVSAVEALARYASADGLWACERFDTAAAEESPPGRRASFWLYRALRRDVRDRAALMAEAMSGTPLPELRRRFLPTEASEVAADLWWPVAFYRLTGERADALVSPAAAEARYGELSRFVVEESGADVALDDAGLLARLTREGVRDAVRERVMALKLELPRVNPLWYNAYVSRGLFLEKCADPKTDVRTLSVLAREAAADAAAARAMSAEARRLLAR